MYVKLPAKRTVTSNDDKNQKTISIEKIEKYYRKKIRHLLCLKAPRGSNKKTTT